jgi:hypothetical protein
VQVHGADGGHEGGQDGARAAAAGLAGGAADDLAEDERADAEHGQRCPLDVAIPFVRLVHGDVPLRCATSMARRRGTDQGRAN